MSVNFIILPRVTKTHKMQLLAGTAVLIMWAFTIICLSPVVSAQQDFARPLSCGASDGAQVTTNVTSLPSGDVYIRTQKSNQYTRFDVAVSVAGGGCLKMRSVKSKESSWTKIGTIPATVQGKQADMVVSAADFKLENVYSNIASILVVNPKVCKITQTDCIARYGGAKVLVEPKTLSGNQDHISLQVVKPFADQMIDYVDYFDGGEFLYRSKSIDPVDERYLRGGERQVRKTVHLSGGSVLHIDEVSNQPNDPLYSKYLSSSFFRLSRQFKIVIVVAGVAIIGLVSLGALRFVHKRRQYMRSHGFKR